MKRLFPVFVGILFIACRFLLVSCQSGVLPEHSLLVSENNRYLTHHDGSPFLWIGDTAWELFHRLDREEAVEYLENRAEKGFSIIQAVVLAENDGLRVPNSYGDVPLIDLDPAQPNEAYFEHVDFIVDRAEELGLFVGMLPTWGDKVFSEHPGAGPIVFDTENARVFGRFLGERYREKPIVWILGGDRNIANEEVLEIWRSMAAGLKEGDGGRHLITYHPRGGSSSSRSLHNEEWLDFNMYQSGHAKRYNEVYRFAQHDLSMEPPKPVVDGEPAYEDIALKFWDYMDFSRHSEDRVSVGVLDEDGLIRDRSNFELGFFTDADVRVHGYWNFLSGACGYIYGNNAIWQMFKKGGEIAIPALTDWREAMDRPGAGDLRHMRRFFEEQPFHKLIPDRSFLDSMDSDLTGANYIAAARADDHSFYLVYLSLGQPVEVDLGKLEGKVSASWFDTREGYWTEIGVFNNNGSQRFTPPSSGEGQDWMLVLDNALPDV